MEAELEDTSQVPMMKDLCRIDFYSRTGKMVPSLTPKGAPVVMVPEARVDIFDLPMDLVLQIRHMAFQLREDWLNSLAEEPRTCERRRQGS